MMHYFHLARCHCTLGIIGTTLILTTVYGCSRTQRVSLVPPVDLVAYGLVVQPNGDDGILAGKGTFGVTGKMWSGQTIVDNVIVKILSPKRTKGFITADSVSTKVLPTKASQYEYKADFDAPKRPGMYLIHVFYGSVVVDESAIQVLSP